MPYKRSYKKKNFRKKRPRRKMNYSSLIKTIKRVDTRMEFKRSPMLRAEKSHSGNISPVQLSSGNAYYQCPFQDVALTVGTQLDKNQRLSSIIYPQVLKFNCILRRKNGATTLQRFRVMVFRYVAEMDFTVNNSILNGWDYSATQWSHICRVGELWSQKPYIKNQIKVLYDKHLTVNDSNKTGCVVDLSVPIKRKMTFENANSGANSVGAGNIVLAIVSDDEFDIASYSTVGFYKDLQ